MLLTPFYITAIKPFVWAISSRAQWFYTLMEWERAEEGNVLP